MADQRSFNVEDRIRELGEDPETAYANAKANGMAGDAPPPTSLAGNPAPVVGGRLPPLDPFGGAGGAIVDDYQAPQGADVPVAHAKPPTLAPIASSGTIADTQGQNVLPDFNAARPVTAPLEPPASFGDLFTANRRIAERDSSMFDEKMLHDGYAPIVRALGLPPSENPAMFHQVDEQGEARFGAMGSPSNLATAAQQGEHMPFGNVYLADRSLQESLIIAEIKKHRAQDPNFLPGVPDTPAGIHQYFADQQKKGEAADEAVIARSPGGLTGFGAALAGSATGTMEDPVNLAALAIPGGESKSLLQIAARDALINGVVELGEQPMVAHNKAELGENYTLGDAARSVGAAALGGAVLGTALHGIGKGAISITDATVDFLKAMPEAVRAPWIRRAKASGIADNAPASEFFATLNNHELAQFARDASGDKLTPDQQAAANVLERAQEVGESSPYQPGPAGDGTHESALAVAIKDLEDRRTPEARGVPSGPTADGSVAASPAVATERPPAPSTVGRPQPLTGSSDPEAAIASFNAKVGHAENATGNVNAKNPNSSASGPAQFTDPTFRDYYRKVYGQDPGKHPAQELKNNPEVQSRLLDRLTRDNAARLQALHEPLNDGNLYVMHFLGEGDGAKVFKADPATPIEDVVSPRVLEANPFLKGKSASEVIAWAHGRMGAAHVASVRAGATPLEAATDDPTNAQLNGAALQLGDEVIAPERSTWNSGGDVDAAVAAAEPVPPMYARSYPASSIAVDADRFQFKSGGDQSGITDRLKGVTQWNPMYAGRIVTWEDEGGRVFVADGHQRVGLATRLEAQGHAPINMDAITLRAADGVSAEDARTYAALKNIAEGTGTAVDAAKVIRDAGPHVLDHLPPKSALVRDGGALARLSDRAFGAVYNDVIPADYAAVIGHLLPHQPEAHEAMVDLLAKLDPANRGQAESIVRQAIAAGIHKEEQVDLFGTHEHVTSLMLEKAKITERVLAELRKMRLVHKTAAEGADALEAKGSKIAREQSAKEAQANAQAIETVNRLAYRAGPISDAIGAAARELKSGGKLGSLARDAAERIRELDLAALTRDAAAAGDGSDVAALTDAAAGDDADRLGVDGSGRGGDAGEEGPQSSTQPGDQEQPSLLELEQATERFSDPDGKAVQQQADSLVHDLKAVIAFHGTDVEFDHFAHSEDIGFHFGDMVAAQARAQLAEPGDGRIIRAALDIKNPLRVNDLHTWEPHAVVAELERLGILTPEQADAAAGEIIDREFVRDALAAKGYDSIVYRNETEGNADSYIVFDDRQIKRLGSEPPASQHVSPDVRSALMESAPDSDLGDRIDEINAVPAAEVERMMKAPRAELGLKLLHNAEESVPALKDHEEAILRRAAAIASIAGTDEISRVHIAEALAYDRAVLEARSEISPEAAGNGPPAHGSDASGTGQPNAENGAPGASEGLPATVPAESRFPTIDRAAAAADPEAEARRLAVELERRKLTGTAGMGDGYKWSDQNLQQLTATGERAPKGSITIDLEGAPGRPVYGFKLSEIRKEAEALDHSDAQTFRVGEEGGEITAADLLKDLDDDDKALKAIKDCL